MSKFSLVIIWMFVAVAAFAQQDHFMLIQAADDQPFFVQLGGKNLSSSAGGHLIIPELKDSVYLITVGFPKHQSPDLDFSINVYKKDLGFQLKNLGEKGWSLFNTQTMELILPVKKQVADTAQALKGVRKDDPFSRMMAGVVDDTAVMYNTNTMVSYLRDTARSGKELTARSAALADTSKKVPDSVQKVPGNLTKIQDSGRLDSSSGGAIAKAGIPAVAEETPFVELLAEHRTASAINLSFADHTKGRIDTVQVSIPLDTVERLPPPPLILPKQTPASTHPDSTANAPAGDRKIARGKPVVINSDCRNFATEVDVTKLKAKLRAIPKDEDRILNARKTFRLKCFTSNQVKDLCELFTNDASKFSFLEAAYPFVSDDRFRDLSVLLTDPFYSGKFKAMTGQ
ncbi:MAG: DUF4476 domain-containing protein [Bacteroidota bacterium]|nr:DUF4476 domain-containing protein [Bacteroidota bacterium]